MPEMLCLQWKDFKENVTRTFGSLKEEHDFVDVTLACEDGKQFEAHKVILAASSPFFHNILRRNKHSHPLIYMRGIKSDDLFAIIDFLYSGEVNVHQENLDSFLSTAEELQLEGLTEKADNVEFEMPAPVKEEPANQKETNKSAFPPQQSNSCEQEFDMAEATMALKNHISKDFQEVDEQTNSLMVKTSRKNGRQPIYKCKACGKEDVNSNLKKHIEAHHLDGVSLHCSFCEKTFRTRETLKQHKNVKHHTKN